MVMLCTKYEERKKVEEEKVGYVHIHMNRT